MPTKGNGGGYTKAGPDGRYVYSLQRTPREGDTARPGPDCQVGQLVVIDSTADAIAGEFPILLRGADCPDKLPAYARGASPDHGKITSDGKTMFITTQAAPPMGSTEPAYSDQLVVFDLTDPANPVQKPSITIGKHSGHRSMTLSGDGKFLFVVNASTNPPDKSISQVEVDKRTVMRTLTMSTGPRQVATWGTDRGPERPDRARTSRDAASAVGCLRGGRRRRAALVGCAHDERRSSAEARAYHYQDSSGLLVGTYGAVARQPLPGRATLEAQALADYVRIDPGRGFDPTRPDADRGAPDAVTSASATAGGGKVASKWRFEGQLGVDLERELRGAPSSFGLLARASTEPDYRSLSGAARAATELFERNTTLAILIGYGRDLVRPVEVPRGQEALWPDQPRPLGRQPDRRPDPHAFPGARRRGWPPPGSEACSPAPTAARWCSRICCCPKRCPGRATAIRASWRSPGLDSSGAGALHLKQGGYLDSWSVRAFIPELTVAAEMTLAWCWRPATGSTPVGRLFLPGDLRRGPDHHGRAISGWVPCATTACSSTCGAAFTPASACTCPCCSATSFRCWTTAR